MRSTAILLVDCHDAKGIVAAISNFLYSSGANILNFDQHQDNEANRLFMRVEFDFTDFILSTSRISSFEFVRQSFCNAVAN